MKIFKILLLIFLSSSVQSFEDIYLECGKEEGYFNIVFGFTQSMKDRLASSMEFEERIDAQIATTENNGFKSGYASKGRANDNTIYIGTRYSINRVDGKAYSVKKKYYSMSQKRSLISKCMKERSNLECAATPNSYIEETFIGNCSVISKSTAEIYADKLFTPKTVEKKF